MLNNLRKVYLPLYIGYYILRLESMYIGLKGQVVKKARLWVILIFWRIAPPAGPSQKGQVTAIV